MGTVNARTAAMLLWGALLACGAAPVRGEAKDLEALGDADSFLTIPLAVPARAQERNDSAEALLAAEARRRWEALRAPVEVGRRVWLVWNVRSIELGPVRMSGSQVVRQVRYLVRPMIVFQPPAARSSTAAPTPRLLDSEPGDSVLHVSSVFPIETAELFLASYMHHQRFVFTQGYTSRVSDVRLQSRGESLWMRITLDGDKLSGKVDITGTLRYSVASEQLHLDSAKVTYDDPKTLPPRATLALQERLNSQPFWKLSTDLGYTTEKLKETLRQGLGPDFDVKLSSVRLKDIRVSDNAFTILGSTTGRITLATPAPRK